MKGQRSASGSAAGRGPALTVVLGLLVFWTLLAVREVPGVVNPHDSSSPDYCSNCRTDEAYTGNCDEVNNFCLLAGSVDALCLICHVKEECCPVGQAHQAKLYIGRRSHPSDLEVREVNQAYLPRTLPVQDGTITCRTCHRHSRRAESDYKMLRIVKKNEKGVDWSVLCADCHTGK